MIGSAQFFQLNYQKEDHMESAQNLSVAISKTIADAPVSGLRRFGLLPVLALLGLLLGGCSGQGGAENLLAQSGSESPAAQFIIGSTVDTSYGRLVGASVAPPSGATVSSKVMAFLGVPYAKPPVGNLRWRPPQEPAPWTGERAALMHSLACLQAGSPTASLFSGEDCLYLNIYAPATPGPHPVMFWLHGGAFLIGAGSEYDGATLAREHDVVVVTVNYRLSFMGFLALTALGSENGDGYSGNQGFYDQLAALKWVNKEIAKFGGDTSNITVFGQSAGAMSTCLLLASPLSDGLFQRAVMQSGNCNLSIFPRVTKSAAEQTGSDFLNKIGCANSNQTLALACARSKSTQDMLTALDIPYNELFKYDPSLWKYLPSIVIEGAGKMFPQDPMTLLAEGAKPGMPVLIGSNKDEGSLFNELQNHAADAAGYYKELQASRFSAYASELIALYPHAAYESTGAALSAIAGDAALNCTARRVADVLSVANHPVYSYNFIQPVSGLTYIFLSLQRGQNTSDIGVFHVAEVPYVFGASSVIGSLDTAERQKTSSLMSRYWVNFARSGNPNGNGLPAWPRYYQATPDYLELGGSFDSKSGYRQSYCQFWATHE